MCQYNFDKIIFLVGYDRRKRQKVSCAPPAGNSAFLPNPAPGSAENQKRNHLIYYISKFLTFLKIEKKRIGYRKVQKTVNYFSSFIMEDPKNQVTSNILHNTLLGVKNNLTFVRLVSSVGMFLKLLGASCFE